MDKEQPEAQERKFWKRLCALNRFSFFYMGGGVARASDKSGGMNLPDPAPYATPVAQAFAQASAMVNTFGTTTTEATWALQKWQTEYLRMRELWPRPPPARALGAANYADAQQQKLAA